MKYLTRDQFLLKLGPLSHDAVKIIEMDAETRFPVLDVPKEAPKLLPTDKDTTTFAEVGYKPYNYSVDYRRIAVKMTQEEYDALAEAELKTVQKLVAGLRRLRTETVEVWSDQVADEPAPTPIRRSKYAPDD